MSSFFNTHMYRRACVFSLCVATCIPFTRVHVYHSHSHTFHTYSYVLMFGKFRGHLEKENQKPWLQTNTTVVQALHPLRHAIHAPMPTFSSWRSLPLSSSTGSSTWSLRLSLCPFISYNFGRSSPMVSCFGQSSFTDFITGFINNHRHRSGRLVPRV